MESKNDQISVFHCLFIIIASAGLMSHVIVLPVLLNIGGRDSWISVLIFAVFYIAWILILHVIQKKTQQKHIFLWLADKGNKTIAYLFSLIVTIYLLSTASVSFLDTITWANITYLPETPGIWLSLTLSFICFLSALSGIKSIAIINGIMLPVVILFGFLVAFGNIQFKDYSLLRPFLENGWKPVLEASLYSGFGLLELFFIILYQHKASSKIKLRALLFSGIVLVMLTLGPLIGAIVIFGPHEAAIQRYPAYEQWGMLSLGRYIEHLDFLSVYQWMAGIFIRISLLIYIIPELFNLKGKRRMFTQAFVFLFLNGVVLFNPLSDTQFLMFVKDLFIPFSSIFIVAISFLLAFYSLLKSA
ncbi:GerAB/ArcD/ProY family transporter [Pseudalkalibacillus caeni]|uniref:Spore gernimation protein n=1 Tax=Exobacillus caeni TaxID=2574798 RepID=A0A5R9F0I3_9BACL|nr:endospore germination permease [Pseudalkalibacillus caeni]TLS37132.1 spore gernimation protein [Pseudalkalibacillus caeni]